MSASRAALARQLLDNYDNPTTTLVFDNEQLETNYLLQIIATALVSLAEDNHMRTGRGA